MPFSGTENRPVVIITSAPDHMFFSERSSLQVFCYDFFNILVTCFGGLLIPGQRVLYDYTDNDWFICTLSRRQPGTIFRVDRMTG